MRKQHTADATIGKALLCIVISLLGQITAAHVAAAGAGSTLVEVAALEQATLDRLWWRPVVVRGLTGRPELNGLQGSCGAFRADRGRFLVKLPGYAGMMLLAPRHLFCTVQDPPNNPMA